MGCCNASDVIDGEYCIISVMRGSGGNVNFINCLLRGVGVHVDDRKEGAKGSMDFLREMRVWWPLKLCSTGREREG